MPPVPLTAFRYFCFYLYSFWMNRGLIQTSMTTVCKWYQEVSKSDRKVNTCCHDGHHGDHALIKTGSVLKVPSVGE